MSSCTSCGLPIPDGQGSSCSMCYGDMGYGSDGYYEAWAAEEMRQEELKEEEIRQYQEELQRKEKRCAYCDDRCRNIFEFEELSGWILDWGASVTKENADYIKRGVFIDRGWLRLVDLDGCGCMDHGERVKLKFCPFCGKELEDE